MPRQLVSLFVALCIGFAPQASFGVVRSNGVNTGNVSITGGVLSDVTLTRPLGVEYKLARTNITVAWAPTGTMANNGAMTLGTAMNTTYANGYWLVPAGAIAAGVPAAADFYYGVASSTTAVTLFNNLLSANLDANGMPTIPASPTAFSTTGPGAFTGVTAAATALTLTVPAAVMGTNGVYRLEFQIAMNSAAGTRTVTTSFGGTSMSNPSLANLTGGRFTFWVNNRNSASVQSIWTQGIFGNNALSGNGNVYAAVNTGSAVSVTLAQTRGVATDTFAYENVSEWITNQ